MAKGLNPVLRHPRFLDGISNWLTEIDRYICLHMRLCDYYPKGNMDVAAYEMFMGFLHKFPDPLMTTDIQVYALTAYVLCLKFWVDLSDGMQLNTVLVKIMKNQVDKKDFIKAEWTMLCVLDLNIREHTEKILAIPDNESFRV